MTALDSKVAVTGIGVVNPAATGILAFEKALRTSQPILSKLEGVPVPRGKATVGLVTAPQFEGDDKGFRMASSAAAEALNASGLCFAAKQKTGLILATMAGDSHAAENCYAELKQAVENNKTVDPALVDAVRAYPNGDILEKLCKELGVHGPRFVVSNACASGNIAVGLALDMLRSGRCENVLVVGVEVMKLSMLWGAERASFVGTALRPFHTERDGAILGEGAGAIVMSKHSVSTKKTPVGWIEGFGSVCDRGAAAITLAPDGSGLERAMMLALQDSKRSAAELEYVNCHAPGTRLIDAIECSAVARLGDKLVESLAVNATKSITTHLSGAAAVTEIIATLLQMNNGFVHGNAGLDSPDPALDLTPQGANSTERDFSFGLSNACGGGGLNTSIAVSTKPVASTDSAVSDIPATQLVITGSSAVNSPLYRWFPRGTDDNSQKPDARLSDFDIYQDYPLESNYHYMNRAAQLAAVAGSRALQSAEIGSDSLPCANDRFGVIFGTSVGGSPQASQVLCNCLITNPNRMTPNMSLDHGIHLGATLVCRHFDLTGTTYTITGSRRSGLQALEIASLSLQADRADAALVGGYDSNDEFESLLAPSLGQKGIPADSAAAVVIERAADAKGTVQSQLIDVSTLSGLSDYSPYNSSTLAHKLGTYLASHPWEVLYLATPQPALYQRLVEQALELVPGQRDWLQLADDLPDQRAGLGMSALVEAIGSGRPAAIIAPGSNGVINAVIISPPHLVAVDSSKS